MIMKDLLNPAIQKTTQKDIDDLMGLIKADQVIIDVDIRIGNRHLDGLMGLEILLDCMMHDYLNSLSKEDIEMKVMHSKMGLYE